MYVKQIGLACLSACFLVACQGKSAENSTEANGQDTTQIADGHTSQNALDWQGVYKGVVPCADCEGIETTLVLNPDNTYVLQTLYLGKGDPTVREKTGSFTWAADGLTITLSGIENAPTQYRVGENQITQLDMAGQMVTGDLAAKYVLAKQ